MSERLYPSDETMPLAIMAVSGERDRPGVVQLRGDHGPTIVLTEEQVQALVDVLTDWLYERKVYRLGNTIRRLEGKQADE